MADVEHRKRWHALLRPRWRLAATIGVAVFVVGGITVTVEAVAGGGSGPARPSAARTPASSLSSSSRATTPSSSSTTVATTTTAAAAASLPGIGMGDSGPAVQALQQRLADLKYDPGAIDGHYGTETWQAVVAFQKVMGLARTGRATPDVLSALATATPPAPLVASGGDNRVEIDLPRQVLMLYEGGQLVRTMMISSGGGYRYCVPNPPGPDQCDVAITPGGSFRVFYKFLGEQTDKLGQLYNPLYFNGGIAIHGEPSVPLYPASHGCVRIPMSESIWFFNRVPVGEPVYVVGGSKAPVPFNATAPVPGSAPGSAPATTAAPAPATTAPPSTPPPTTTSTTQPAPTSTTAPATTTTTAKPGGTTTTTA